jgi:hypothetical protein
MKRRGRLLISCYTVSDLPGMGMGEGGAALVSSPFLVFVNDVNKTLARVYFPGQRGCVRIL